MNTDNPKPDLDKIIAAAKKATKGRILERQDDFVNILDATSEVVAIFYRENQEANAELAVLTDPDTMIALCDELKVKDELIFAYDATRTPMIDKTIIELRESLEQLACLGNGDWYGNSEGNVMAQKALGYDATSVYGKLRGTQALKGGE